MARMLVQIYETSTPEEAGALGELGVYHIGVLVGDGSFPRERTIDNARVIFSAMPTKSKVWPCCSLLTGDLIEHAFSELKTEILHLGASTDLPRASTCRASRGDVAPFVMRSIPVVGELSLSREEPRRCCRHAAFIQQSARRQVDWRARRNPQLGYRQENCREREDPGHHRRRTGTG
jgi:hypothetical protein